MAEKQPLKATFFAFRKRERGGVLTGATIVFILLYFGMFGAFAALNWQGVLDYVTWTASTMNAPSPDTPPAEMFLPPASVMALGPMYMVLMFVTYLLMAAYEAACLKWMIHGETGGFFGLSLGADTWRVWLSYWLWLVLFMAFYIGCLIIIGVLAVVVGMNAQGDPGAVLPLVIVAPLLLLAGLTYFGVRFAPAAATSIARRRFSFFTAWTVTKGRFWSLLGSYLLIFLIYMVMLFVGWAAIAAVIGIGAFNAASDPAEIESQILQNLSSPQTLVPVLAIYAGTLVVAFIFIVALYGINARAVLAALEEGKITPAA